MFLLSMSELDRLRGKFLDRLEKGKLQVEADLMKRALKFQDELLPFLALLDEVIAQYRDMEVVVDGELPEQIDLPGLDEKKAGKERQKLHRFMQVYENIGAKEVKENLIKGRENFSKLMVPTVRVSFSMHLEKASFEGFLSLIKYHAEELIVTTQPDIDAFARTAEDAASHLETFLAGKLKRVKEPEARLVYIKAKHIYMISRRLSVYMRQKTDMLQEFSRLLAKEYSERIERVLSLRRGTLALHLRA
ncbi:MAG: hypothetical protein QS99_C0015G0012 [archaeon GW2011_AR4]|nr:MAG: hypothetical protein QS99_C0015G0012 [archaeon GW2011_AR4]